MFFGVVSFFTNFAPVLRTALIAFASSFAVSLVHLMTSTTHLSFASSEAEIYITSHLKNFSPGVKTSVANPTEVLTQQLVHAG